MTSENQYIYNSIDLLVKKNVNFALFRLPNDTTINLVLQNSRSLDTFSKPEYLKKEKGFVIAPFHISESSPILFIRPEVVLTGEENIFKYIEQNFSSVNECSHIRNENDIDSGQFNRYEDKFKIFHQELEKGQTKKLVLSRTFDTEKKTDFFVGELFRKACDKYPSNFIFVCNTMLSGTWFGCSPESLLSGEKNNWKTDALAGTQDISTVQDDIFWDDKNQLEQNIVVEYMKDQLLKGGLNSTCSNPKTIKSGSLVHLRSELSFHTDENFDIGKTLSLLHPSPAVCGFPKEEAFRFILENEGYDRSYYSGFLGYMDTQQKTDLFVNLRCAQIFGNKLKLYAGGGILTSSELMSEWDETEYKLQTILSIL